MTQPQFLVYIGRNNDGTNRIVQAPQLRTQYREVTRVKRVIPGLGQEVEHAGWDNSQLLVKAAAVWGGDDAVTRHTEEPVLRSNGTRAQDNVSGGYVRATAAGVKARARRIRPEEAATIDQLDQELRGLEWAMGELRRRRSEAVREAWSKGHVVRLNEVLPAKDERWHVLPGVEPEAAAG